VTHRVSIAVACLEPAERASVSDWLSQSGYDPVAVSDLSRLDEDLHTNPVEALIAEMAMVPSEDEVRGLMRRLGSNRPLMILGDASRLPTAVRGDLSVIDRPLTRESLLLSVGLALAEGRPSRRFPRRDVEPIPAVAHGIGVTVREASVGGVGLEVAGPRQAVLPPYFELRVPAFGVHVVVKRAWLVPVGPALVRCGGTVEGDLPDATRAWSEFAREAPAPVASVKRRMAIDPHSSLELRD
jgi:hypothetical protein